MGRPGRPRVTPEQKQARFDTVLELFIRFASTHEIHEAMLEKFKIGPRAVDFLIREVREKLRGSGFDFKPPELRIERERAFRFMQQTASDASLKGNYAAAARAGREIALMLGCYTDKVEISGPGGGPLALTVETARSRVQGKLEKLATPKK